MVLRNKLFEVGRTHMLLLLGKSIIQVKIVNTKLVRHHHITVIRNTLCDPVMSADGLKPPDLVDVLERDTVHLVSPVLLQKTSEADHTFSRAADIRKRDVHKVFLTDSTDDLLFSVLRRL